METPAASTMRGTWIACDTNNTNPGGDDTFVAVKVTETIGSGKIE